MSGIAAPVATKAIRRGPTRPVRAEPGLWTSEDLPRHAHPRPQRHRVGLSYAGDVEVVRDELRDDPTVDITTTGRRSGHPRRIEIWMLDVDGRFFITGTPGRRHWLANLTADPRLVVHLKRRAHLDLDAQAIPVSDAPTRRQVLEHLSSHWYRTQVPIDELIEHAPMVEVLFEAPE